MKYNLKNRPNFTTDAKTVEELHSDAWHFVHMELDKWFEGFEKELRDGIRDCEAKFGTARNLIKELLGEDSSGVEQR